MKEFMEKVRSALKEAWKWFNNTSVVKNYTFKREYRKQNRPQKQERENKKTPYFLLTPWLIGLVIFVVLPVLMIVYMSVHDVLKTPQGFDFEFIGIDNFLFAFTNPDFYQALFGYVGLLVTYIPVIIIISFLIALLLNNDFQFRVVFRVMFFLPVVLLSNATLTNIVNTSTGENTLLNVDGVFVFSMIEQYIPFMANGLESMFNVLIVILWFTGVPIVLYINGLQKINRGIYEAARIDGGNSWQILWLIIIPNIKSTALVIGIFSVVQVGIYNINPLFLLLQDQIMMTATNLGNAATYAFLYTVVTFLFIGVLLLLLREKDDIVIEKKRYIRTQELYELQKQQEAMSNE
ncbi:carbohydrate ABC transporter permease [Candidatus Xianfuyuplasma coldseepsis]|uniref:Sugar ABC transporter permease n=1 Tax=Candidatus Xianfuyuplasma coldseepsis TaxID=2782163 RepID=A0A7L7KPR5_9MOLU|nr:sugar ABC transporter permease [Xianfuyuplasma coldseepsis]QMS84429.1 sugar ABC transporter permease [Xianfuyuplasma coldseepsis]